MKLQHIKLLTDENISPKGVKFFREQGVSVVDVKEEGWHGTEDDALLKIAYQQQRMIVTHDADFGTLAINQEKPCYGIWYLRLKNLRPLNVIHACQQLLSLDIEVVKGMILVIEEHRVRMRHLFEE